jgi:superfamily II DNA or RNA helicase
MRINTLRPFQSLAIQNGVDLFEAARYQLDAIAKDSEGQRVIVSHNGALLIEAPTGCGKTLMAGSIVEKFSAQENVVWFWFAPFAGVIGQTQGFLRAQFPGLRLRDLSVDRNIESWSGDTFVTTWQTVATRVRDQRNVRRERETAPSVDTLVGYLRGQGLRIGVVVDEAHHGFGAHTQAAAFFHEVLRPEYSILVTATPDDAGIKAFEKAMGIAGLRRIRVSRADAVEAGLIKTGVKCSAYVVDDRARAELVDLQLTALRDGVSTHRLLKQELARLKIDLTPLMLVQVDSSPKSVEKARARLLEMGFAADQIATHTASEPDADLLALANDERREVLIFKMAVALGFDAPRAFTLVSMRASRDRDFGVQLIGRILRVHWHLQGRARRANFPDALNYGYVFLSNFDAQEGLDKAGQLINQIHTEYASVSPNTVVMNVCGGEGFVGTVEEGGQVNFLPQHREPGASSLAPGGTVGSRSPGGQDDLFEDLPIPTPPDSPLDSPLFALPLGVSSLLSSEIMRYQYPLRPDAPRGFRTQRVSAEVERHNEACARHFIVNARDLLDAMKSTVAVEKRTLEIFTQAIQRELSFPATLSPERAASEANRELCRNDIFDPRRLKLALLEKLSQVMREEAIDGADESGKVRAFLNIILANSPGKLRDAQKKALAEHMEVLEAEPLPEVHVSLEPLRVSPLNIYGIYPDGLNDWERSFAAFLDMDPNGNVLWWHRNEPRKPWSVNVTQENGRGFYPDFVVGVRNRPTALNALLVDPKFFFEIEREAGKVRAAHADYGRVLILSRFDATASRAAGWMTVVWDERRDKAVKDREFRLSDAAGW